MTSVNRNDGAHRGKAHRWSRRDTGPYPAPEPDPVHPQARPATATAVSHEMRPRETAAAEPAASPARASVTPTKHDRHSALAADHGTPAVLKHRVVALSVVPGDEPLRLCTEDAEYPLIPLQAQVWARAGRLTVVTQDGSEHRMTLLGPDEGAGLHLGDHWPVGEPDSKAKRAAHAAAHDVGNVVTFPAWLNRTTRRSGERNAAMHALVKRLRQASPDTRVYYGQTVGFDQGTEDKDRPYDHRGIIGHEGYPTEL
ncbi:hypothetical protein KDL01_22020 [Actinospica durhamensis]|uniref:Uncharacterized protein n=1 Tax=Actinospica durhamensis TaxID=1508375 RepID=A0A941ET30_9ACTN|nr:hypothetical protein [Actinospica durhamensis]MBR7835968.1 hypothetical protein [Actinospica durhamensis]